MRFGDSIQLMRDDIIKVTQELVRIKSVHSEPENGAPFGSGVKACLDRTLEICEEMGFKTINVNGYAGHAEYGEGDEIVGILVHLDVVPEGSGWSHDPYGAEIVDGRIFGRGTIDDKGPAVAAMYALKAVKDSGVKFNRKVRIIFGCDEESGRWECMKHYFAHESMPACGFSPDGEFPIINSEKGILIFKLEKSFKERSNTCQGLIVNYIKGGTAPNSVPDYCECELEMCKDFIDRIKSTVDYMNDKLNMKLSVETLEDGKLIIKSYGISAHGSTPEKGINAITQILVFLSKLPLLESDLSDYIKFLAEYIGMETNGHSFGLKMSDDVSGALVFNLGLIDLTRDKGSVSINIRYPVTKDKKEVYDIIKAKIAGTGIELIEVQNKDPLYVPADNFLIKKLQKVYENVTGSRAELISIGGGTYARAIKNAVAFGPLFPGKPEMAHQKDEYIEIEDLIQNAKIYAEAIYELVNV